MSTHQRQLSVAGFERVIHFENPQSHLSAIIAIHSTNLGPACGGIRMLPYRSENEALEDVLRLAKSMSYKSALAAIGFGGGKSVIIHNPEKKTPALFQTFGECVETLGGKYIAAKDMNIESADLVEVKKKTKHVLGIEGQPDSSGDPSPVTARGLFRGLEATVEEFSKSKNLSGLKVAIQGIGHVGYSFAEMLFKAGAELWVADIDENRLRVAEEKLKAKRVPVEEIYATRCDVFAPCAQGAILNRDTIPKLKCKAVVGSANNQLATGADGSYLHEKGILYAPDYAVNSGGIINIFIEYEGYNQQKAFKKADEIYQTLKEIFKRAREKKTAPFIIADQLAEERLYGKR